MGLGTQVTPEFKKWIEEQGGKTDPDNWGWISPLRIAAEEMRIRIENERLKGELSRKHQEVWDLQTANSLLAQQLADLREQLDKWERMAACANFNKTGLLAVGEELQLRDQQLVDLRAQPHQTQENRDQIVSTLNEYVLENGRLEKLTEWQPISTAPKDKRIILHCPKRGSVFGRWQDDRYAKKPRPYWTNDLERTLSTLWTRDDQPTHWMPLPVPPREAQ